MPFPKTAKPRTRAPPFTMSARFGSGTAAAKLIGGGPAKGRYQNAVFSGPSGLIRLPQRSLCLPSVVAAEKKRKIAVECSKGGEEVQKLTYKDAGVDIDAGSELVRRIAKMAPGIGGFGGLFPLGIV